MSEPSKVSGGKELFRALLVVVWWIHNAHVARARCETNS